MPNFVPSPYQLNTCAAASSNLVAKFEDAAAQVLGWYGDGRAMVGRRANGIPAVKRGMEGSRIRVPLGREELGGLLQRMASPRRGGEWDDCRGGIEYGGWEEGGKERRGNGYRRRAGLDGRGGGRDNETDGCPPTQWDELMEYYRFRAITWNIE